jgi:hypothetical protein
MEKKRIKCQRAVIMAVTALISIFIYLILHELGHCIVVWIQDGIVTKYKIIDPTPHMSYKCLMPNILFDVMGALFPVLLLI